MIRHLHRSSHYLWDCYGHPRWCHRDACRRLVPESSGRLQRCCSPHHWHEQHKRCDIEEHQLRYHSFDSQCGCSLSQGQQHRILWMHHCLPWSYCCYIIVWSDHVCQFQDRGDGQDLLQCSVDVHLQVHDRSAFFRRIDRVLQGRERGDQLLQLDCCL
jgi:hypothetical protein